jgi:hypothetical protein
LEVAPSRLKKFHFQAIPVTKYTYSPPFMKHEVDYSPLFWNVTLKYVTYMPKFGGIPYLDLQGIMVG